MQKTSWTSSNASHPEDQQKLVAELPRDIEVVKAFKTITEMDPLSTAQGITGEEYTDPMRAKR